MSTAWSSARSESRAVRPDVEAGLVAAHYALSGLARADEPRSQLSAAALEHARLVAAAAAPKDARRAAVTAFVAEALVLHAVSPAPVDPRGHVLERVADATGLDARSLALEIAGRVLTDVRLSTLPSWTTVETVLGLLAILGPVEHVSLWRRRERGRPACMIHVGSGGPTHSARDLARRFLAGASAARTDRGLLQVHPIPDLDGYALIARPTSGSGARSLPFLRQAARALRPALARLIRLEREMPSNDLTAAASERRLARIGFDLHDGPIQVLAALLADTRLLHSQVARNLDDDPHKALVLGRLDDLKTMMVAVEFEMRTLCQSLESPTVLRRPFERVIEQERVSLERTTGIRTDVELSGRFDELTPSQRIALLRVVQEALRNVREHADAAQVSIAIRTGPAGTHAVIRDDGRGFEVEEALARAVRDGRVGLIGMMERLRLLGGTCEVASRPGGPTTVTAMLPCWPDVPSATA